MDDNASIQRIEEEGLLTPLDNNGEKGEDLPRFIYIVVFFACVGGFLFGYDTGVVSGAILLIQEEFHLTLVEEELVVSVALGGAMVGSFFGGPAADRYGRRITIGFASFLFILGSLILGFAWSVAVLIVGRFVVGTGIGLAANIVPVFVAELSPPKYRGSLVTVNNVCITGGQFISYLVDAAFVNVPQGWRYMLGIAAVPGIIQLLGMMFIVPESPRWLVSHSRIDEATAVLKKTRGQHANVAKEIVEIQQEISQEKGGFSELFSASVRPALFVGVSLQAFQQLCGINTAMYYSATILKLAGFKDNSTAIWFSVCIALTNALGTAVAIYLIDRIGRRKLLLNSMVGMILGLVAIGMSFFLNDKLPNYTGIMAVCSLVIYVAFFSLGMSPVPWAVNSEIYPQSVRGLANGVATTVNWTSNLVVSITFLSYINLVGKAFAFWTYAGMGVFAWILFFFILPETRGKSFEQIQHEFKGGLCQKHL